MVPGFAVTLALFPRMGQISWAERIGSSFVFGITPQLLLYFLAKNLSVPIDTTTSLAAVAVITVAGVAVWKRRIT